MSTWLYLKFNRLLLPAFARATRYLMSQLSDYAGRVSTHLDKIDAAHSGLSEDVAFLKAEITRIQNSAGTVTPEDQAILNAMEARISAMSDRVAALDALTPPPVPAG